MAAPMNFRGVGGRTPLRKHPTTSIPATTIQSTLGASSDAASSR